MLFSFPERGRRQCHGDQSEGYYKVINAVPEDLKKPFMMFVAGFKYREIAEKMDLPVGTIKSRLFLIRKRLQQDLKDFS